MSRFYEPLDNRSGSKSSAHSHLTAANMSSSGASSYKTYIVQIQACNAIHVLCGLVSLGLAFVQFSPIGLDNNYIDFRLLNFLHIVTGFVGVYMVIKNNGSICAKVLYHVSLTLALFSVGFYAESLQESVEQYKEYQKIRSVAGRSDDPSDQANFDELTNNQMGKIIICAVLIATCAIESVISVGSIALLDYLASDHVLGKERSRHLKNKGRLTFVAVMKIFLGCVCVALSASLEHMHKKADKYITTGLNELAGGFALISGIADIYALYTRQHQVLNLKVSMVFSIVTAVMAIKTLDYMMVTSFLKDLRDYTGFNPELQPQAEKRDKFVQFVVNASVIGCLFLVFFHSVIAAIESGSLLEKRNSDGGATDSASRICELPDDESLSERKLHRQRNILGALQLFWGACLVALAIISFVPSEFSSGYTGVSILWLGLLFFVSGCIVSKQINTFTTSVYVLSVICTLLSLEYLCYSINLVAQSMRNKRYANDADVVRTGRVILYAIQAVLFFLELITACTTALRFDHKIRSADDFAPKHGLKVPLNVCAVLHLVYALFTIALSIVSEVAVFQYNIYSVPSFVKLTNGVVVFAISIVQMQAASNPKFLRASGILQIVSAMIAAFVISPVTSSLYRQVYNYRVEFDGIDVRALNEEHRFRKQIMETVVALNAIVLFLTVMDYVISVASVVMTSYLLHHYYYYLPNSRQSNSNDLYPPHRHASNYHYDSTGRQIKISPINHTANANHCNALAPIVQMPSRYFGNDFRIYSEKIYHPSDVMFAASQNGHLGNGNFHLANGSSGGAYGNGGHYSDAAYGYSGRMQDSYAQTNIRHVFHSLNDVYLPGATHNGISSRY